MMIKYCITLFVFLSVSNPSFAFLGFLTDKVDKAKANLVCANLQNINNSLQLYRLDHYRYPTSEEGLAQLVQKNLLKEKYIIDPWGTPYQYQSDGTDIVLSSLGEDKESGGKDLGADITLESCLTK